MSQPLLLALLLSCTACATGVSRVELRDPVVGGPPAPGASAETGVVDVVLSGVRDTRQDPERVGAKQNTSGRVVGDAVLAGSEPLESAITEHVRALLERTGYRRLEPGGVGAEAAPQLELEVTRFWSEFGPGAFSRGAEARVELSALATRGPAQPSWSRVFSATAEATSLGGAEALLSGTLNDAYAEVMGQLAAELESGPLSAYLRGAAP